MQAVAAESQRLVAWQLRHRGWTDGQTCKAFPKSHCSAAGDGSQQLRTMNFRQQQCCSGKISCKDCISVCVPWGPAVGHSLSSWEAPLGPQSFLAAVSASDFLPTWLSHLGLSGQVSMPAPDRQEGQLLVHVVAQLLGRIAGHALPQSRTHTPLDQRALTAACC